MKVLSAVHVLACSFVAAVFLLSPTAQARAQATNTAQRPADLQVFGGYSLTKPDFGAASNSGLTFGADYDRSFGWRFIPGLELRGNFNSGPVVKEHTYVFGPRLHMNIAQRYHPYADLLAGIGGITYPGLTTSVHDGGPAYSAGLGVNIDVAHNVMFKADYQFQNWNMGSNGYTKPAGGDFTLTPRVFTLGVSYRIPFRHWLDQAHSGR